MPPLVVHLNCSSSHTTSVFAPCDVTLIYDLGYIKNASALFILRYVTLKMRYSEVTNKLNRVLYWWRCIQEALCSIPSRDWGISQFFSAPSGKCQDYSTPASFPTPSNHLSFVFLLGKPWPVHEMKACGRSGSQTPLMLNLSTSLPSRFTSMETPGTPWIGGCVGTRPGLDGFGE